MSERQDKPTRQDKPLTTEKLLPMLDRPLPWSDEAEKGVLSCLLQDPTERITEARRVLLPEAFYHPGNQTVYEALLALDAQMPRPGIDAVTVTNYLREKNTLDTVGGPAAISELYGFVPIPSMFPYYVGIVRNHFVRRNLARVGAEIVQAAQEHGQDEDDQGADGILNLVTGAEARTFALLEMARGSSEHSTIAKPASVGVAEWIEYNQRIEENRGKIVGLETGILELDATFHGLDDGEGEMLVIAGRPGQGKTAIGCTIANHLAVKCGVPGLVFSIEMSGNQFYIRMVLGMGEVDTSKAFTGHYSQVDQGRIARQAGLLQRAPLFVCDNAAINEMELLAQLQYFKRKHGIRWAMVDHLHKVRHSNPKIQHDERMRLVNVMEVLRYAKKQLRLGLFVLVQMSRETDRAKKGEAPTLADLSGSGAIEQDTEGVVALHRPPYHTPWHRLHADQQQAWRELVEPRRGRNPYQWSDGRKYKDDDGGWAREDYEEDSIGFVLKNRRGPTPEVHLRYQPEFTRFGSRMPKLNSDNELDWQIGTYRMTPKKSVEAKQAGEFKGGGEVRMDYSKKKGSSGGQGGARWKWNGKEMVPPDHPSLNKGGGAQADDEDRLPFS